MKEHQVNSVKEYLEYMDHFKKYGAEGNFYFRGQLSRFTNMKPSVARKQEYFQDEDEIYNRNSDPSKSTIQNLAKMQHDGIPTRLLDFTTDPLVALFFATNDKKNKREDSSVYIFIRPNSDANSLNVRLSAFVATQNTKKLADIVAKFNLNFHESVKLEEAKEILSKGLFIRPDTVVDKDNYRMQEQKGTFAIPGNKIKKGIIKDIIPFENEGSYEEIVIPFECQDEIREQLKHVANGYTSSRLFGESNEKIVYPSWDQNNISLVRPRTNSMPYKKYTVTAITNELMTFKEMKKFGYELALKSGADAIWIWFKRNDDPDETNIEIQRWFKKEISLEFNLDWSGEDYRGLCLSENRQGGYVPFEYFHQHPNRKFKHLPVSTSAEKVELNIKKGSGYLKVKTNLAKNTKMLMTYQINNGQKKSIRIAIDGQTTIIPLEGLKLNDEITGDITMIVSALQDKEIRYKYGIDYEELTGDFIQRSDDESMVYGYKSFILS